MPDVVIKVQNLAKKYTLGAVHTNLLSERMSNSLRSAFGGIFRNGSSNLKPNTSNLKIEKDFWALKDVSFEVKQGEVIGIIGRNGAGKSTLLKVLSKITAPTLGRVEMVGRVASLLEVGTGFHPELTGRENIFLNGAILGMSKSEIRKKFDEIVAFAEVEKFIDTPVKRYSSGMYVRLAFAVAAHLEPEILIIDEVLAVGDASFQKKCLGKMKDVSGQGRTVLFVSHNMAAISNLCDIGIFLKNGTLISSGIVSQIVDDYLSYISKNIGNSSSNLSKYISTLSCIDETGEQRPVIPAGCQIIFKVDLCLGDLLVRKPRIGIGINSIYGTRICTVGTFLSKSQLPSLTGNCSVLCRISSQNLAPGNYSVKIALGDYPRDFDSVNDAASFTIAPSDYYGNGQLPEPTQGVVLTKSEWEVSKCS